LALIGFRTDKNYDTNTPTIIGGLDSAVAETLSENCPVRLKRMGIADVFTESGPYDQFLINMVWRLRILLRPWK
jgi:transketolase